MNFHKQVGPKLTERCIGLLQWPHRDNSNAISQEICVNRPDLSTFVTLVYAEIMLTMICPTSTRPYTRVVIYVLLFNLKYSVLDNLSLSIIMSSRRIRFWFTTWKWIEETRRTNSRRASFSLELDYTELFSNKPNINP